MGVSHGRFVSVCHTQGQVAGEMQMQMQMQMQVQVQVQVQVQMQVQPGIYPCTCLCAVLGLWESSCRRASGVELRPTTLTLTR